MKKLKEFFTEKVFPIFLNIDWKNVNPSTYVRYILAVLASVNTCLNVFNINPINVNESVLYDIVSILVNIIILFVNTYKDNPTSAESVVTNKLMKALKSASETKAEKVIGELEDILSELNSEDTGETIESLGCDDDGELIE